VISASRMHELSERLRSLIPSEFSSRTKVHVRMGPVVEEINRCAEMTQARLIVMGTRCRNLLDELIFGAITYGVLRSSPYPVWIVPCRPSEEKHAEQKHSEV